MNIENILQILQTIGICVSAIALTVIAFFVFTFWTSFFPVLNLEDEESESLIENEGWKEEESQRRRKRGPRKR